MNQPYEGIIPPFWPLAEAELKRWLLVYDRLGIHSYAESVARIDRDHDPAAAAHLRNSVDFLIDEGVIFEERHPRLSEIDQSDADVEAAVAEENLAHERAESELDAARGRADGGWKSQAHQLRAMRAMGRYFLSHTRVAAAARRFEQANPYVFPVLDVGSYAESSRFTTQASAIAVTVSALPLPSDDTPFEELYAFSREPDTQRALRRLRRWFTKVSSEECPVSEVREELETMLDDFRQHIRIQGLKSGQVRLDTLIKLPLDLAENLVKLRLSKLVDPLFAARRREVELLEAELRAPGRDIAFVARAQDAFR